MNFSWVQMKTVWDSHFPSCFPNFSHGALLSWGKEGMCLLPQCVPLLMAMTTAFQLRRPSVRPQATSTGQQKEKRQPDHEGSEATCSP